jgi:hypothetical protein
VDAEVAGQAQQAFGDRQDVGRDGRDVVGGAIVPAAGSPRPR